MMNGSLLLEGYVPEVDATIVTRLLNAGAVIVGKSNCEELCLSGGLLLLLYYIHIILNTYSLLKEI